MKTKQKSSKLCHQTRPKSSKRPQHLVLKTRIGVSLQERGAFVYMIKLFAQMQARYGVDVFEYSVQKQHLHLFVLTPIPHLLGRAMAFFASKLALFFNRRLGRHGTFWEDRFFSSLKKSAREIVNAIAYIANQCKHLSPFENCYSSIGQATGQPWGIPDYIQRMIGTSKLPSKLLDVIVSGRAPYHRSRLPRRREDTLREDTLREDTLREDRRCEGTSGCKKRSFQQLPLFPRI